MSLLSSLAGSLAEGNHNIKYEYGHDNKSYEGYVWN